jgi:hypothetical protein
MYMHMYRTVSYYGQCAYMHCVRDKLEERFTCAATRPRGRARRGDHPHHRVQPRHPCLAQLRGKELCIHVLWAGPPYRAGAVNITRLERILGARRPSPGVEGERGDGVHAYDNVLMYMYM